MARCETAMDRHVVRRVGGPGTLETSSNSRNLWRDTLASKRCRNVCGGQEVRAMGFGLRSPVVALAFISAISVSPISSSAWAGDDGAAPLWQGIGSIFGPVFGPAVGFGFGGEKPPPIEYREHGKLVLPPNTELPPPGSSATADPAWPVDQEIVRRKAQKEEGKKTIAGVGDARLRYTHSFPPNEPVTVRSVTPDGQTVKCEGACGSSSSVLGNLNPLNWVGMGKSGAPLGPEPDREWLTDPPTGFRAPVGPIQGSAKN
jgi:hypothetical protein